LSHASINSTNELGYHAVLNSVADVDLSRKIITPVSRELVLTANMKAE
jgi:hypothetical protein